MENFFVLIALTFVGVFQQSDATPLVSCKNIEEFREIFFKFAGDDKILDFGELMLMIGRRIMKYDEPETAKTLEGVDVEICRKLMLRTVTDIFCAFVKMAGDDKELTFEELKEVYMEEYCQQLFIGTWIGLQVASPPKANPEAAENL